MKRTGLNTKEKYTALLQTGITPAAECNYILPTTKTVTQGEW